MSEYNPEDITINGETWLSCSCGHHFVIDGIIARVKSQTSNDLLREIMEEMPKKAIWGLCDDGEQGWLLEDFNGGSKGEGFNDYHDQVNTILESKLSTVKK